MVEKRITRVNYATIPEMKRVISSVEEMLSFGAKLGAGLRGGETFVLTGDVGAGKTVITKGIAKGMAVDDDVQSPTFTISRVYEARDALRLAHYDFYRLNDAGIMRDELHEVLSDNKVVTVIEWADIVEDVVPKDSVRITITPTSESVRELTIDDPGRVLEGNRV